MGCVRRARRVKFVDAAMKSSGICNIVLAEHLTFLSKGSGVSSGRVWNPCSDAQSYRSGEQQLQILPRQAREQAMVGLDDGVGEIALGLLQLQDLLFNGVAGDDAAGEDGPGLADAVRAVDGLRLDGGIPPRIEQVDVVGGGEIEPQPSRLEADQEKLGLRIGLEGFDPLAAVAGLSVEIQVRDPFALELLAKD